MADGAKMLIRPIYRNDTGLPEQDLQAKYAEMAAKLRDDPKCLSAFLEVVGKVLAPFAEKKGELAVYLNSPKCYFTHEGKPFSNFGVILLRSIQVHYADHVQHDLELLILGQNLSPKITRIEAKRLRSNVWIDDLGPKYICEQIQNLKVLIQAMAQYAPVTDEYMYSGWVVDGGDTYIMGGQQFCGDNWNTAVAKETCVHTLEMLDAAPHTVTVPLLAIALLSLVQSRMMDLGDYFKGVCSIIAPTQSFKTTLASLFFDFASGREADINFEATMAAIVRTIGNCRDSTVIVDDFKPGATKTENNELVRKLSTVIRMCSDDSGGVQKAGAKNDTFSNVSHGLVVVTAEQIQLQVQSTLARLLILEMNRKSVSVEKLTYFQKHHDRYQEFIKNYIQYIASQGVNQYCEQLLRRFIQERNTLRNELLAKNVLVDNRSNDMCVWLDVSFGEFLSYALQVGAISSEQTARHNTEAHDVFLALMEQQAERVADLNPVKQFSRGLRVLLDAKDVKIGTLQARNSGYSVPDSKEAIGFKKKGFIYLKNGIAVQAVAAYYRRVGRDFTISDPALRKALADSGYIVRKNEKSYIHRLFVNHESYQCIAFEQEKFEKFLQGGLENGAERDEEIPSDRGLRANADHFLGRRE